MKVYGPYVSKVDNRKRVVILFPDGTRKTTSYARYQMEQKLGRQLTNLETVDHIDEDKTNDLISNYQILSRQANIKKSAKPKEMVTFNCLRCGEEATKKARNIRANLKKGKAGPFCSRHCAGKYNMGT